MCGQEYVGPGVGGNQYCLRFVGYSSADTNAGAPADFDDDEVSDYCHVLDRVSVSTPFPWEEYPSHVLISMAVQSYRR